MAQSGQSLVNMKGLGADDLRPKDKFICVFVPSKKRNGEPIDHEKWRDETVFTLSKLFGGATTVPGFGGWLDDEQGMKVKQETISMVVSFMVDEEWNENNILELRKFLHRMGRETDQGEIGILINGVFWRIRRFDHE